MRLLTIFALLASPAWAQDMSERATLDYSNFSNIEVKEGVAAYIQVGPVHTVTAIAPDGGLDGLKVQKFGKWLVLSRDPRWLFLPNWKRDERLEVVVTLPALGEVKALDRAAVTVVGARGDRLRAEVADRGDLILDNIDYDATTLVLKGEGTLVANGDCDDLAFLTDQPQPETQCSVALKGVVGETINLTLPEQDPAPDENAGG